MGTEDQGVEMVKHCPSLRDSFGYATYYGTIYYIPFFRFMSYAPNRYVTGMGWYGEAQQFRAIPFETVGGTPALTIAMVDSAGGYPYTFGPYHFPEWSDFTSRNAAPRHFNKYNSLFLDGHVEPCTIEEHYTNQYWSPPRLLE
jgi:prepilin-type processing-associated H-X9-DG protein